MSHIRPRHAMPLLLRKLTFAPVVAIQGARQTGKSFLVRELLKEKLTHFVYKTLDKPDLRDFARSNPESFISQNEDAKTFAIDEAQKAPDLFDVIKYKVDLKRIPGQFLLLGSTEFSKLTLVRESLTGRMSRVRLYPLNLAEVYSLPPNSAKNLLHTQPSPRITRHQLLKHLERGGMPGIFGVSSPAERNSLLQDWLDLTTQRDILLFKTIKIDPELCFKILQKIAFLEEPEAGHIAKSLKTDLRKIKTHLMALKSLFVIHALPPHPLGSGKTRYFLCDVAFARRLGASFERQLYTWLVQEQVSQRAYREDRTTELFYYRTPKGSIIHLILEIPNKEVIACKLFSEEKITSKDLQILTAFKNRYSEKRSVSLMGLGSAQQIYKAEKISVYPWESLA